MLEVSKFNRDYENDGNTWCIDVKQFYLMRYVSRLSNSATM